MGDVLATNYFNSAGSYKVMLEAAFESCTNRDSLLIHVLPLPKAIVSIVKVNETVKFKDHTPNIVSRKWYINNSFFALTDTFVVSKTFVNTKPVKLEITNTEGCASDTVMFLTSGSAGKIKNSIIRVYPNPANTLLVLEQPEKWVPSRYEIYDVLGQKIISGKTKAKEERIDLQIIKPGVYYLKYFINEDVISIPFIRSE